MVANRDSVTDGNDDDCIIPRILSQKATKEILGDNLSSIIAIGKDFKPYLYLPYGTDENSIKCDLCEEEAMTFLDIIVQAPKYE
jgi:hypothetical protein